MLAVIWGKKLLLFAVQNYNKLALIDLSAENKYKKNHFLELEQIVCTLKPLELAVKELSKDNAMLMLSQGVFLFIIKKT